MKLCTFNEWIKFEHNTQNNHRQSNTNCSAKENEWMDSEKKDSNNDVENQALPIDEQEDKEEERLLPECDGLWYMGQSKKHRYMFL